MIFVELKVMWRTPRIIIKEIKIKKQPIKQKNKKTCIFSVWGIRVHFLKYFGFSQMQAIHKSHLMYLFATLFNDTNFHQNYYIMVHFAINFSPPKVWEFGWDVSIIICFSSPLVLWTFSNCTCFVSVIAHFHFAFNYYAFFYSLLFTKVTTFLHFVDFISLSSHISSSNVDY